MGLSAQSSQHRISGSSSPTLNSGASTPALTSSGYRSRETGIIEKLLVSYGFIKCADREGRLFFHYSQFHGEATNLRVNGILSLYLPYKLNNILNLITNN